MSADEQGGLLGDAPTVADRLALAQRAGGVLGSVLTAAIAFFIGGLVVLASGANPLSTYRAIFDGSGLNWLFPCVTGLLKATVGAHEVITTIMLNWIAVWVGSWLFGHGGALQSHANGGSTPVSNPISPKAHLHVFWGSPVLQGLDVGFFVALACLAVFAVLLSRTTLGFEVRAVGFNPQAARYAGIGVARTYVITMAIAG